MPNPNQLFIKPGPLVGHMNKLSFFSLGHEIYLRISFKNFAHFFNSVILNSLYFFYCEEAGQITS